MRPDGRCPQLTGKGPLPYKPHNSGIPTVVRAVRATAQDAGRGLMLRSRAFASRRRTIGETDLSTEQAGAQTPSRLPRAHGDEGRPPGHPRPPRARTQAAQRLSWWKGCGSGPISLPPHPRRRCRPRHSCSRSAAAGRKVRYASVSRYRGRSEPRSSVTGCAAGSRRSCGFTARLALPPEMIMCWSDGARRYRCRSRKS